MALYWLSFNSLFEWISDKTFWMKRNLTSLIVFPRIHKITFCVVYKYVNYSIKSGDLYCSCIQPRENAIIIYLTTQKVNNL